MESSPGTGDDLTHGPPPHASQTSTVESPTHPEFASEASKPLSRSSSLLQQKRSSLPPPVNSPVARAPPGTPMPFDVPDDGYDFLRAIASQERRVMELREELQRAETDLSSLKKQWALSEKTKKRAEISHHAEQMHPLRSPDFAGPEGTSLHRREQSISSAGSSSVPQERVSRELDRRNSMRAAPTTGTSISSNGRRVFHGSHTRALSLLSPVTAPSPPTEVSGPSDGDRASRVPRSATLPSVERDTASSSIAAPVDESQVPQHLLAQWQKTMPPPSREALMRTGKQMASDLREGLWTFLEDIRQATVGEEGINGTDSRTRSPNSLAPPQARKRGSLAKSRSRERLSTGSTISRSSSSSSRGRGRPVESSSGKDTKPANIDATFWHEFGVDSPAQKSPGARRNPSDKTDTSTPRGANDHEHPDHPDHRSGSPVNEADDTADNWDVWDTPMSAAKTHTSFVQPLDGGLTPSSPSFGEWNPSSAAPDPSVTEGIPWPAITKNMTPTKLQRTASNLMAEWERSLSPSPERGNSSSVRQSKSSKKD
ncbi:hypothetical protein N7492_000066 [Penicillium capsulatum]|uniref:DUF4048 domain-containing protein n=1 Tax=Penicillium capsulatum TaxID=69766 RepID=A0A9W9IPR1_9EURO|nr:hypothetical protein N7492_000066 [Penicillium capsulatum]